MENSVVLAILVAVALFGYLYFSWGKIRKKLIEWLEQNPAKGEVSYSLSESTTQAFEEVRRELHKKYPKFELVDIKLDAGKQKTLLEYGNMSKEELRRSGEGGYGIYGRLFVFKIRMKVSGDINEVVAKCRVESNKPGIWKAAFVEFDGAEGQTGHPQKIEKTPLTKPVIQAKKVAEESEGLPTIEDVAAESLEQIAATPTLSDDPAPETIASPTKPIRRRRSAKAIGGMSEL